MNYQKIYDDLMIKARSENRKKGKGVYYEAHHIKPKCMGGEGLAREWRTHPNIILLTGAEHFLAHKLLVEIYPNEYGLIKAYWGFVNGHNKHNHKGVKHYNVGNKEYERIREQHANALARSYAHTTEEFKVMAKNKHGENYDYTKVKYVNMDTKVVITCKVDGHGDFKQRPSTHIRQGSGCPKCGKIKSMKTLTGRTWSEKQKLSVSGENSPMYKKTNYDVWLEKHGEEIAKQKWEEMKKKQSLSRVGSKRTQKTKDKQSQSANDRKKRVSLDGVIYESLTYASKVLNINRVTLLSRVKSTFNEDCFFC
jgi:hypothetical protein